MSTRTITLTDRPPVTITEEEWPCIAIARWHDARAGCETEALRVASVRVRAHADGRRIVYGVDQDSPTACRAPGPTLRAGRLTDAPGTVGAIRDVAARIGHEDLGDDCIADLPAEVLR